MPTVNDPNGYPQAILPNGYALNYVAQMPMQAHSGDNGDTYSAVIAVDTGAVTCDFFYLKNTSDMILRIYKIKACTSTLDLQISIVTGVTGTPSGGATLTPVNSLVGSGNTAECTCEQKTGDMALTGGSTFDILFLDKDFVGEQYWDYTGEIALNKNQTLVFNCDIDPTADIDMTVYFYFHEAVVKP